MRVWNWPVLPVMPCVTTRVFLSIRMLIRKPPRAALRYSPRERPGRSWLLRRLLERRHHLLRRLGHRVRTDDRQARLGEHLLAELLVGPLHAHDERHAEVGRLAGGDHAFGDRVAAHDAAE